MPRKVASPTKAKSVVNVKAGFDKNVLPAAASEEETARKQAEFEASGPIVEVITDEWYGQIEEGNPFNDAAEPFIKGNPDKHFRFLSALQTSKRGKRGYQEVRKNGKGVEVQGQKLAFIPEEVHEQRRRKVVREAMDQLQTSRETYREQEQKAVRDSGGSIGVFSEADEVYEGNRRAG